MGARRILGGTTTRRCSRPHLRGPLYESARFIVEPLLANTETYGDGLIVAADTSIWEERQQDKKHFAFSTAMAIVGLGEFAGVARRAGDSTGACKRRRSGAARKGFRAAFIKGSCAARPKAASRTTSTAPLAPMIIGVSTRT